MEGFDISRVEGRDELDALAAVTLAATPERARSAEQMEASSRLYPGGVRFLARAGDEAVGAASGGRIYVFPPDYPAWWADLCVLPSHRRQGIGSALYEAVSAAARAAGKSGLGVPVRADRVDAVAWLGRRGFTEAERAACVALDLTAIEPPAIEPPEGIELTTLAERPDLRPGAYAVAVEAIADIPVRGDPMSPGTFEDWSARDASEPRQRPEAFFMALSEGTVVGYAAVAEWGARTDVAGHDMTAVARAFRGRGVASALKRATIAWAKAHGYRELLTENDVDNAPMRAINRRLGYQPLPDEIRMRGPLAAPGGGAIAPARTDA